MTSTEPGGGEAGGFEAGGFEAGGFEARAAEPAAVDSRDRPPGGAGTRLVVGTVLLLLALVLFGGSRLLAAGQRHAYDAGASAPPTYHLTAAKTYQLSSARSVAELKKAGLLTDLACYFTSDTGVQEPAVLSSTMDDDRNLHVFATLTAPATGDVHLSCTGIADVFIDDADNAGSDRGALLMLLALATGLLGVIAACSGGYALADPVIDHPAGNRSAPVG